MVKYRCMLPCQHTAYYKCDLHTTAANVMHEQQQRCGAKRRAGYEKGNDLAHSWPSHFPHGRIQPGCTLCWLLFSSWHSVSNLDSADNERKDSSNQLSSVTLVPWPLFRAKKTGDAVLLLGPSYAGKTAILARVRNRLCTPC